MHKCLACGPARHQGTLYSPKLANASLLCTLVFVRVVSAGAGAILVNPWNINDLSQAIEYALMMGDNGGCTALCTASLVPLHALLNTLNKLLRC
jgi:hypothetical protein